MGAALAGLVAATAARAAPRCADGAAPAVELDVSVGPEDGRAVADVTGHVVAVLGARGIGVCVGVPSGSPVARIRVSLRRSPESSTAEISITDVVTSKRVERSMRLDAVPSDMRASAVANATDELCARAGPSWSSTTRASTPPPREVVEAVEGSVKAAGAGRRLRAGGVGDGLTFL